MPIPKLDDPDDPDVAAWSVEVYRFRPEEEGVELPELTGSCWKHFRDEVLIPKLDDPYGPDVAA